MWIEKNLLLGAIIVVLIGIGIVFYFDIQPGNKLYESEMYGFKTEYPGTWQENGAEANEIVTFIGDKNIYTDYRPNTDILIFVSNKTMDEFLIELKNGDEELSKNEITLSGAEGVQMMIKTEHQNVTYKQEYIVLKKFEMYYVILNTDIESNFNSHADKFNIMKNNFAFTNVHPDHFGGTGDLISDLKQKYYSSVPVAGSFEWAEGNQTYDVGVEFSSNSTAVNNPEGLETDFSFIEQNPLSSEITVIKERTINCLIDAEDQCVELTGTTNEGYTVEKRTYLVNKENGLIEKISVKSSAGSFYITLDYE